MDIIERLHNCPNCGGTLQDDGACRFCGSKVYDFVSVDVDKPVPTYIRIKMAGNIVLMPVRFNHLSIESSMDTPTLYFDNVPTPLQLANPRTIFGTLEFTVIGDIIAEDTKITGSEY